MSLYDEVEELLKDHQPFHSELQIDAFITAKAGGTPFGQYKQSLRELASRWSTMRERYLERASIEGELNVLESSERMTDREAQIEHIRKSIRQKELERTIADAEREFVRFLQHAKALKAELGELTDERRRAMELEFWEHQLKTQIAVSLLQSGRIPATILEMLPYLPDGPRDALLEAIDHPNKTLAWYRELRIELPELPEIEFEIPRDIPAFEFERSRRQIGG